MFVGQYFIFGLGLIVLAPLLGKKAGVLVLCALCVWSCVETIKGLLQVFEISLSGAALYKLTGSFFNPGPYGGFISMTIAVAFGYTIRHRKTIEAILFPAFRQSVFSNNRRRWLLLRAFPLLLSILTILLGIAVLPASRSRAAWLSIAAGVLLCIKNETNLLNKLKLFKYRQIVYISVIAVLTSLCVGVFMMKKESAIGRFHIWRIELKAISYNPLLGSGKGTSLGMYGLAQERFFGQSTRSQTAIRVAGSPEYVFNEYLRIGIEYGIPALLLSLGLVACILIVLLRSRSLFTYGMTAAVIFAFFSYPLSLPQTSLCITLFISIAIVELLQIVMAKTSLLSRRVISISFIVLLITTSLLLRPDYDRKRDAIKEWENGKMWGNMEHYEEAAEKFVSLYEALRCNHKFMYDYGYALHKIGKYEKSIEVLEEGALFSCDPAFRYIIGKNYEALGLYENAEREFTRSYNMVPSRLYPLILLMEMYDRQDRVEEARKVAEKVISMPVNQNNLTMIDLHDRARSYLKKNHHEIVE